MLGSPEHWLPKGQRCLIREMQTPTMMVAIWQEDTSQKVMVRNLNAFKAFLCRISIKAHLYHNLVVHDISLIGIILSVSCALVGDVPWICVKISLIQKRMSVTFSLFLQSSFCCLFRLRGQSGFQLWDGLRQSGVFVRFLPDWNWSKRKRKRKIERKKESVEIETLEIIGHKCWKRTRLKWTHGWKNEKITSERQS